MKFEVKASNIAGLGLFAKGDIPKGEIIYYRLPIVDEYEGDRFLVFEKIYDLRESELQYMNHSDNPNMDYESFDEDKIKLIVLRDIKAGEEITIDYGWTEDEKAEKGIKSLF